MHFLNKIIKGQSDEGVHRRFVKFSKGLFMNGGPVLLAKLAKNGVLSLNASFEYEDLVGEFISNHLPDMNYTLKGSIYTQPRVSLADFEKIINNIGLDGNWEKGKRDLKNLYFLGLNEVKSVSEIKDIYSQLNDYCFILLNIIPESGKSWNLTTKDKIPSLKKIQDTPTPSCKPDKQEKCNYLQFCEKYGICVTSRINFVKVKTDKLGENEIENFFDLFITDFKEKVSNNFTEIVLANQYMIEDLTYPPNKDELNPKELRERIKKKGDINRILMVDNKEMTNNINFEA